VINIILLILASFMASCGYTSPSLIDQNVQSVYVPIFDNDTFRRDLEYDLTKAIKEEILFGTQLKIVDEKHADTILTGILKDVQENVLIENPDAVTVESRVNVFVQFSWLDQRTGRILIDKQNVAASAEFIATRNEDIRTGEIEAFVNTARKIINLMERKW